MPKKERVGTCRFCHKPVLLKEESRNIEWVERSINYYYHKDCWEQFIDNTQIKTMEQWQDLIFDLIKRELCSSYNYFMIVKQLEKMRSNNLTMKGIYFSAYYWFVIKKNEYKPEFGLGIIPFIYEESTQYWIEAERKKKGLLEEIAKIQAIEAQKGRKIKVNRNRKKKVIEEPD